MKLQVDGGTDAVPTGGGYIQAGPTSGANVVIDNNELMARNADAISNLHINANGGDVILGGPLDIGIQLNRVFDDTDTTVHLACPENTADFSMIIPIPGS